MKWPLSLRDEANAITAYAFRNGFLETLHAGRHEEAFVGDQKYSRITDEEMKRLMIEASKKVAYLLEMRDKDLEAYRRFVAGYWLAYCTEWERAT
jgi:hypothetical protein